MQIPHCLCVSQEALPACRAGIHRGEAAPVRADAEEGAADGAPVRHHRAE